MIRNDAQTNVHICMCVFGAVCTAGFVAANATGGESSIKIIQYVFLAVCIKQYKRMNDVMLIFASMQTENPVVMLFKI